MTQQQYGRAIVRGEQSFWTGEGKPDWLPGDVLCQVWLRFSEYNQEWSYPEEKASLWEFTNGQFRLRLPDYQFVYDALDRGERPDFTNRTTALAGEPETSDDMIHIGHAEFEDEPLPTYDPAVFGIYDKATHVPVRMMTREEAAEFALSNGYFEGAEELEPYMGALYDLGIIRPTPDRVQVIADKYSHLSGADLVRAVIEEVGK